MHETLFKKTPFFSNGELGSLRPLRVRLENVASHVNKRSNSCHCSFLTLDFDFDVDQRGVDGEKRADQNKILKHFSRVLPAL